MSADLDPFLRALLPGDDTWPSAGDLGLDLWAAAAPFAGYPEVLERVAALSAATPESQLRELEAESPAVFTTFQVLAYGCYYSHPEVLAVMERRCGYPARPPQPQGQLIELPEPDPLPSCRGTAPRWRLDGSERAREVHQDQAADPDRIWTKEEIQTWRV